MARRGRTSSPRRAFPRRSAYPLGRVDARLGPAANAGVCIRAGTLRSNATGTGAVRKSRNGVRPSGSIDLTVGGEVRSLPLEEVEVGPLSQVETSVEISRWPTGQQVDTRGGRLSLSCLVEPASPWKPACPCGHRKCRVGARQVWRTSCNGQADDNRGSGCARGESRGVFGNLVIDKRRLPASQLQRRGIPSYVAEWVLDNIVPGSGPLSPEDAEKVQAWAARVVPGANDQGLLKHRACCAMKP